MQKEDGRKWRTNMRRKPKITGEALVLHDLHKVSENISAGGSEGRRRKNLTDANESE
jgi:hypothetical protein